MLKKLQICCIYFFQNYNIVYIAKIIIKPPFCSLWETVQTLFWAIFGLVDLDNFELTGIKEFTRFSGLLMFGSFSVINIIVLLNLLIAMMNHSYQNVSVSSVSMIFYIMIHYTWFSVNTFFLFPEKNLR